MGFHNGLAIAQVFCMVLHLGQNTTELGGFLGSHAAVLVEIERFVSHRAGWRRFVAHPTDRPRRSISSPSPSHARLPPAAQSWLQPGGMRQTKVLRSSLR